MSKFLEVVGESLKGMNVGFHQGFREGGVITPNKIEVRE